MGSTSQQHNLASKITLHGEQPHSRVLGLMQRADIFLQHSIVDPETGDEEGLPVAILEAMANAVPVISTRHAGIPEAVVEGTTGYLVDEMDWRSMASFIVGLALNPKHRVQLGKAGWRRANTLYSWERERTELLALLGLDQVVV